MFSRLSQKLSIRAQLLAAVVLATAVASIVAASMSLWREIDAYAGAKRLEATATAGLFASMASEAVRARDEAGAHVVLRAMSRMPSVVHVRIADSSGETLAEHGFGARLVSAESADGENQRLGLRELLLGQPISVTAPVVHGGAEVGSVQLLISTSDLTERLWSLLANAGLATVIAVGLGFLAARSFRKGISARLNAVAGAMAVVQRTHSYDMTLSNERKDELGVVIDGFNGMMREIRSRDRKLAEHRDNLEREVVDRTRDLMAAKIAADEANSAKSQFLATMSHEIRTPLNGLMVMAELLAAADLASRERRYADVIVRSGGTLLAIINDVLDFSKIEAGKIDLEAIHLDIADVVDDVCQLFASKAAAQGLDLAAYVSPMLGRVTGDPVRIGQIVGNLVNNALKFTEKGHVLIEVVEDPDRDGHVLFSVTDTGIGIAADKLATVFDSFSQADQSTARRYGGTGLGLSICQRLVAVMGGEIGVSSTPGMGSRFWFSAPLPRGDKPEPVVIPSCRIGGVAGATGIALARYAGEGGSGPDRSVVAIIDPAAPGSREEAARMSALGVKVVAIARVGEGEAETWLAAGLANATLAWPVRRRDLASTVEAVREGRAAHGVREPGPASQVRYPGARVLVVDDNPVNREVASEALKRFGVVAETANNGVEAVERAGAGGYDLILMDASMPGMDGYEASREIRAAEIRAGLTRQPIVALTAHAIGGGAEAWRAAGMDGLLLKPFNMAQLANCLATRLPPDLARSDADHAAFTAPPSARGADAEKAVLNPETVGTLAMMAAVDAAAVRRIVELFIAHAAPALDRIGDHIAARDAAGLSSSAHAMKSMALSVGAQRLAEQLGRIEAAACAGSECPEPKVMESLRLHLDEAISQMRALPWMIASVLPDPAEHMPEAARA